MTFIFLFRQLMAQHQKTWFINSDVGWVETKWKPTIFLSHFSQPLALKSISRRKAKAGK
ncbi:MAG: hypothetical protein KAI83_19110 [Thiomargarita sp.]|nr:hypothetical protein [Thiomargarita sp.]